MTSNLKIIPPSSVKDSDILTTPNGKQPSDFGFEITVDFSELDVKTGEGVNFEYTVIDGKAGVNLYNSRGKFLKRYDGHFISSE